MRDFHWWLCTATTGVLMTTSIMALRAAPVQTGLSPVPEQKKWNALFPPVDDFVRNDIWRPAAPHQTVPGKDPKGWSFVIEPYAWALGLTGQVGAHGLPPVNLDMSTRKILQNIDGGFFLRGEVRKGRWGLLGDGYYAALSGSGSLDNKIYSDATIHIQQSLVSLAVAYRIIDDRRGFLDVYAGARYNYLAIQGDASLNDSRINCIGNDVADKIASAVSTKLDADIKAKVSDALVNNKILEDRDIRNLVRDRVIRKSFDHKTIRRALADYVAAAAKSKLAAAAGAVDPALTAAEAAAKNKLSKAIASRITEVTPTHTAGNQWWIDPIIGLRGQINLTRWLFLAAQGDAGGFGVGSQMAYNTQATVGVNFTRNFFVEAGYRYMYVDYGNSGFLYNMNSAGFFSGVGIKF